MGEVRLSHFFTLALAMELDKLTSWWCYRLSNVSLCLGRAGHMHHHTHTTTGIQQLWPWAQQRAPLPGIPQQHQQWYSSEHDLLIRPGWQNLHHLHHTEKHPVNAQTSSSHIHHQWPGLPEHTEWDFVLNRLELRTILRVRWPTCSLKCYSVAACQTAP